MTTDIPPEYNYCHDCTYCCYEVTWDYYRCGTYGECHPGIYAEVIVPIIIIFILGIAYWRWRRRRLDYIPPPPLPVMNQSVTYTTQQTYAPMPQPTYVQVNQPSYMPPPPPPGYALPQQPYYPGVQPAHY